MYLNRTFLTDSLWLFARGTSHTGLLNLPGSLMTLVRSLGAVLVAAQGCWAQSWVSPVFKSSIVNDPLKLGKVPPLAPLIIYGAGVLGRSVAKQWLTAQTDQPGKVVGITKTTDNHAPLIALGVTPYMNNDIDIETIYGHHVLFCAPPPRNPDPEVARSDYLAEIRKSLIMWDRGNVASRFVFTSSAGVYAEDGGATVDESSATSASARAQLLLDAEALVLESKGIVVRLAGLYTDDKGAHAAFLSNDPSPFTQNELAKRPDGLINQIHYEDAASAAIVAGLRGVPGEIYLAADDQPLTREAICTEARRTERFKNQAAPQFGDKGGTGKVCDASKLRALGWKPRFASFSACMDYQALIMKAVDEIDKDKRRLAADWSDWFGQGGGESRSLADSRRRKQRWMAGSRAGAMASSAGTLVCLCPTRRSLGAAWVPSHCTWAADSRQCSDAHPPRWRLRVNPAANGSDSTPRIGRVCPIFRRGCQASSRRSRPSRRSCRKFCPAGATSTRSSSSNRTAWTTQK